MAHENPFEIDEEVLADFVEGRLSSQQAVTVARAAEEREDLFELVLLARIALDEEAKLAGAPFPVTIAQRTARDKARSLFRAPMSLRAVFRLASQALELVAGTGFMPLAAPAVRGAQPAKSDDLWEGSHAQGELTLKVEVERSASGAIIAAGVSRTHGGEAAEGTTVALLADDRILVIQPTTTEAAELGDVAAGNYRVEVRRDGDPVVVAEVVLQDLP